MTHAVFLTALPGKCAIKSVILYFVIIPLWAIKHYSGV